MTTAMRLVAAVIGVLMSHGGTQAAETTEPTSSFFEEAKITVNERARADGYLRVRVRPEGGDAREATIGVATRMSENDIARDIAEALDTALAPDYKVDKDAGEHVKIRKAERAAANFSVEITFSAPGFSIVLED
jgi:hypothetical protein